MVEKNDGCKERFESEGKECKSALLKHQQEVVKGKVGAHTVAVRCCELSHLLSHRPLSLL